MGACGDPVESRLVAFEMPTKVSDPLCWYLVQNGAKCDVLDRVYFELPIRFGLLADAAERLDMGYNTLREKLAVLEAEGLVHRANGDWIERLDG